MRTYLIDCYSPGSRRSAAAAAAAFLFVCVCVSSTLLLKKKRKKKVFFSFYILFSLVLLMWSPFTFSRASEVTWVIGLSLSPCIYIHMCVPSVGWIERERERLRILSAGSRLMAARWDWFPSKLSLHRGMPISNDQIRESLWEEREIFPYGTPHTRSDAFFFFFFFFLFSSSSFFFFLSSCSFGFDCNERLVAANQQVLCSPSQHGSSFFSLSSRSNQITPGSLTHDDCYQNRKKNKTRIFIV